MKIIELAIENIKRVKAITIRPDGNMVVIGGDNAQGKSSVLDSICMAIGGGDQIPQRPIRDGQSKAEITLDLGEIVVTRKITASGGPSLVVKSKDGVKLTSPQAVLDRLTSRVSFDPLAFQRMDAKDQAKTLQKLVGIDFTKIDIEKKEAFERRTSVNRHVKEKEVAIGQLPHHEDAPKEELSVSALVEQLEKANSANAHNARKVDDLSDANDLVEQWVRSAAKAEAELAKAKAAFDSAKANLISSTEIRDKLKTEVETLEDVSTVELREQIRTAEETNRKVRENQTRDDARAALKVHTAESETLTGKINALEGAKADMLALATFPVSGLSFDESGVLYQGIPFAQASAAEQLRVSVAMGISMNPKLKVLLIRDGSLLDASSLKMIAEMAKESDAQIWLEKVSKGAECSVIIEDGEVAEVLKK